MEYNEKTLLRFTTTGSVDDGKSTLIGRLLFETKSIYEDQYEAIVNTSKRKGFSEVDLSMLLDGLSAEREQGITIDVAYRYFETSKRKFIIADTPGHIQYTRNMVTGISNADCAVILIDAKNGVLSQSKRHGFIISLFQIPHIVVVVNKMDLVGYSENVYNEIVSEYNAFSQKLNIDDIIYIPVSALKGDNVVTKSINMPWYDGATLLHYLENIHGSSNRNLVDFRFPVQYVSRPNHDFRGFAGRIASGTISPGEEVVVLPSGKRSTVKSIVTYDGELNEAFAPQSVILTLGDEIDVSRGDMIVRKNNLPQLTDRFDATIFWMDEQPLSPNKPYILKHTTRQVKAFVSNILYKIDVNTLHREHADTFLLNELGRIEINTSLPVFIDPYRINNKTGIFILIDPLTNHTVASGIIRGVTRSLDSLAEKEIIKNFMQDKSPNTIWHGLNIPRELREKKNGHKAAVMWFTGYSGSGKSTIARHLEKKLFEFDFQTVLLDGDNVRHGLCKDLGFSESDRSENIRRVGEAAKLFFENGNIVLCAFISPLKKDRDFARSLFPDGSFFEVYVKCDLGVCMKRDPHGLYGKASRGEIKEFTGISSPYEEPDRPELIVNTEKQEIENISSLLEEAIKNSTVIHK
ncbi:MAG: sulfate adenylyltransferase subunit CysN [Prolixibacteraceae bacterium]|nr:sulfate adenylyltransferase subunit CysN [Prolixibacteraceae bacterium]